MHVEHEFTVAPTRLRDTLVDADFLAALGERFGGVGKAVTETGDSSITVVSQRQLPMEYIPAAARSFAGDGVVTQTDLWSLESDDPVDGSWTARLDGAPATMGGGYTITATEQGCRYTVTAEVKVKIPLIGGRVESEIRRYLSSLVGKQMEFTQEWLDQA
jgi:hypothetical protein